MRDQRLLTDAMLGRLTTYLRMCGYDTAYALDRDISVDEELIKVATAEGRCLVTRDRSLADRQDQSILIRSRHIEDQLTEIAAAGVCLGLRMKRCSACNEIVERIHDGTTTPGHAPDPQDREVYRCRSCGKHYWRGSHWHAVARTVRAVRDSE